MIRNLLASAGASSKCRTVDKLDIFGDNSCKALYRLDGNANDESGNYHGTETTITYGGGAYERGAVFNGSTSAIDIGYVEPIGARSLSIWFKCDNQPVASFIYSSAGSSAENGLYILANTNGTIRFVVSDSTTNALSYTTVNDIQDGTYHHAVLTADNTSTKLYIDNSLVYTGVGAVFSASNNFGTSLGQQSEWRTSGVNNPYKGQIDQVRIFNRAITATEVATLYAECAPTSIVDNINPFEDGSLKALYQFNGDATDKTGVYNGTATNVAYGTGKFGQCAVFNGSSSYATLTSLKSVIQQSAFTVSVWIKSTTTGALHSLVCACQGTTANRGIDLYINTDETIQFRVANGGTNAFTFAVTNPVRNGQWNNITVTWDGTTTANSARTYVNGTLKGSAAPTATASTVGVWTTDVLVGTFQSSGWFNGSMEQVRFFNKALTPMEVASLYNETTPLEEPMHSLVDPFKDNSGKALYRLDGNALDESGNYNGTVVGSPTYTTGRFGRAVTVGGANQIVSSYNSFTSFSLSFWAKANSGLNAYYPIGLDSTSGSYMSLTFSAYVPSSSNRVSLWSSTGTEYNLCTPTSTQDAYLSTSYKHFVLIKTSSTTYDFYMNGVKQLTATATLSMNQVRLGNYTQGGAQGVMQVEQVRIFNRALTASEVQTLYTEV